MIGYSNSYIEKKILVIEFDGMFGRRGMNIEIL